MPRNRKKLSKCMRLQCGNLATYAIQGSGKFVVSPIVCLSCALRRDDWTDPVQLITEVEESVSTAGKTVFYRNPLFVSKEMKEILSWPVDQFNEYVAALATECGGTAVMEHFFLTRRKIRFFILSCVERMMELGLICKEICSFFHVAEDFADNSDIIIDEYYYNANLILNQVPVEKRDDSNWYILSAAFLSCLRYQKPQFSTGAFFRMFARHDSGFLKHIFWEFSNRNLIVDNKFNTTDVVALAKGIYEQKAFDRMPILADALQDAGCTSERILTYCQKGPWHKGNLVIDSILEKE